MKRIFPFIICFAVVLSFLIPLSAVYSGEPGLIEKADQYREEKSYYQAAQLYKQALEAGVSEALQREIIFKYGDAFWRASSGRKPEDAVEILQKMASGKIHDRWWAEACESLAEFDLSQDVWGKQDAIVKYLWLARDYWAGNANLDLARGRFIKISFVLGEILQRYWGPTVPLGSIPALESVATPREPGTDGLDVFYREILKVAQSDEDRAHALYSLGMFYSSRSSNPEDKKHTLDYFDEVIKKYRKTAWLDDSYYQLARYYERQEDLVKALAVYKELVESFFSGATKWYPEAKKRMEEIRASAFSIGVGYTFIPGSQVQFDMRWRNLDHAKVSLYRFDIAKELTFNLKKTIEDPEYGIRSYGELLKNIIETKRYTQFPLQFFWEQKLEDEKDYKWHSRPVRLSEAQSDLTAKDMEVPKGTLPPGAYLLLVNAGGETQYDLILVTDMAMLSKIAGDSVLFYVFNSATGEPLPKIRIHAQYRYHSEQGHMLWAEITGVTDDAGILKVRLKNARNNNYGSQHDLFVAASDGTQQSFSGGNYYRYDLFGQGGWELYAFSDRPAYRPHETVRFKGIVRQYKEGHFSTPANMAVKAVIYGPHGNKIWESDPVLNLYGSFSGELTLDEKAPLGEYQLEVLTLDGNHLIARTNLFRLEEYKLPEFLVDIKPQPKTDTGGPQGSTYRLGDTVQVELDAEYYFGGPVAGAEVEYLVYQSPYIRHYWPEREFGWYYEDRMPRDVYYDGGQLMVREKIKTDERGKAAFQFETPQDSPSDLRYRIEARVVDQSRREILASVDIKVTRNGFFVNVTPRQDLYRPGDRALLDIRTLTANDEPVAVKGKVTVKRNFWMDPVYKGKELVRPAQYEGQEMFTEFISTGADGKAVFEFQPGQDGYYQVEFTGYDAGGGEVASSANVFVCDRQSRDIGYRYSGLQIIPEKDTYSAGETARFMLVTDDPGAWVLFTAESDEISGYQVYHLVGTVQLIELPITEDDIPNIFFTALSAGHHQLKSSQVEIIVPPKEQFLNVKITSDREWYSPQTEGDFEIELTDHQGNPVSAEVALGVVDKSVYEIQGDYAGDILKFFYGNKRPHNVRTETSYYLKRYAHLVEEENGQLVDREEKDRRDALSKTAGMREEFSVYGMSAQPMSEGWAMGGETEGVRLSAVASSNASMELKSADMARPGEKGAGAGISGGALQPPAVRSDFRSTVFWQPSIVTDDKGHARVSVKFADSLTTWKATARVINEGTRVGNVSYEVKTKKDVIVRLQAPRFFTERDRAVISANVHNYTEAEQRLKITIDAQGLNVTGDPSAWVTVAPRGEQRVDWPTSVEEVPESGEAVILVQAQGQEVSDAVQKKYAVLPYGIEKFVANGSVLKGKQGDKTAREFTFELPEQRIKESSFLKIVLSPSIAAAMLDALPYLADYPYGCVEQTMSRFLPSVIVAKAMKDLGLSDSQVEQYIMDVLSVRDDPADPGLSGDASYGKVKKMIRDGLKRLYDFQHEDGGWGWWKDDPSSHFMSAYAIWGLGLARRAGVDVDQGVFSRGIKYLQNGLVEEEGNFDMIAWMLHALSYSQTTSKFEAEQREPLWLNRNQLNPYTRALFALSEFNRGNLEAARILAENLTTGMVEDPQNGTVHWGESEIYYHWSEGGVEATAMAIKALSNILPDSPVLEPAVKWLALNRRGARWKNTRDTAIAVLGLTDYLKTTDELNPDFEYEVFLNGEHLSAGRVTADNVFSFDRRLNVGADKLRDGRNQVKIVMTGRGALYVSAFTEFFTLEDFIKAAGNEIFVDRKYSKTFSRETLLQGYKSEWEPLNPGDEIKSGDRVKVDIILDARNNYEYLIVEDYKPAGLEAVDVKSGSGSAVTLADDGTDTNIRVWFYQEFRDNRVVFFISNLPQGKHRISYELRAEVPGEFNGMPNQTHAMYVPEIRANSDQMKVKVLDRF